MEKERLMALNNCTIHLRNTSIIYLLQYFLPFSKPIVCNKTHKDKRATQTKDPTLVYQNVSLFDDVKWIHRWSQNPSN